MTAWLIANGFYRSKKCDEIYDYLITASKKHNIDMRLLYNTEFTSSEIYLEAKPDFVVFWDKDVRLAKTLEEKGYRLFNSSKAIAVCDDKSETWRELVKAGILTPKTITAPMTFSGIGYCDLSFMDGVEKELEYPMVVKEAFGSYGAQVYLCENRTQVSGVLAKAEGRTVIFQEYIKESHGRDIRINVVGDICAASMLRYNDHDFRANITNGGSMKKYSPTTEECEIAVKAVKALGLDFAGVDILFSDRGPMVVEVNSNAHFKNIFDCTGINVAEYITEYIIKKLAE